MSLQIRQFYNTQEDFKAEAKKIGMGKSKKQVKGNILNAQMEQIKQIEEQQVNLEAELEKMQPEA